MARPVEKTCKFTVEQTRTMVNAYGTGDALARALGIHVADARRIARGEGFRPEEFEDLEARWSVVDPAELRPAIEDLVTQVGSGRSAIATLDFVAVAELQAFFNAWFPHLAVRD